MGAIRSMLDRQARATASSTALEHVATVLGGHARAEAMLAQAWDSFRLPGPLQLGSSVQMPQQYTGLRLLRATRPADSVITVGVGSIRACATGHEPLAGAWG